MHTFPWLWESALLPWSSWRKAVMGGHSRTGNSRPWEWQNAFALLQRCPVGQAQSIGHCNAIALMFLLLLFQKLLGLLQQCFLNRSGNFNTLMPLVKNYDPLGMLITETAVVVSQFCSQGWGWLAGLISQQEWNSHYVFLVLKLELYCNKKCNPCIAMH